MSNLSNFIYTPSDFSSFEEYIESVLMHFNDLERNNIPSTPENYAFLEDMLKGIPVDKTPALQKIMNEALIDGNTASFVKLLKNYGATNSEYLQNIRTVFEEENLSHLLKDPQAFIDTQHKYLHASPENYIKIPPVVNYVLLGDFISQKVDMFYIEDLINNHSLLQQTGYGWEKSILWTKGTLSLESEKLIAENNIEIRQAEDYIQELESTSLLSSLMEQKEWKAASHLLSYTLIEKFGGIYIDPLYPFKENINENSILFPLEKHLKTYDYFATNDEFEILPSLFAAKPHHPVLMKTLENIERNYNNPPDYIKTAVEKGELDLLDCIDEAFNYAYYASAQSEGNKDVVFPMNEEQIYSNVHSVSEGNVENKISAFMEILDGDPVLQNFFGYIGDHGMII